MGKRTSDNNCKWKGNDYFTKEIESSSYSSQIQQQLTPLKSTQMPLSQKHHNMEEKESLIQEMKGLTNTILSLEADLDDFSLSQAKKYAVKKELARKKATRLK